MATDTQAGAAFYEGGSSQNSLNASSYNQQAGHTIIAFITCYNSAITLPSDTAGNNWTKISTVSFTSGVNFSYFSVYYCTNCKGNAANVVQAKFAGATYCAIDTWDITGVTALDATASALGSAGTTGISGAASVTFTTGNTADLVIFYCVSSFSLWTGGTQPSGYTALPPVFPVRGNESGSYKKVSSIQSGVTLTWNYNNAYASYALTVGFKLAPSGAGLLLGVGAIFL